MYHLFNAYSIEPSRSTLGTALIPGEKEVNKTDRKPALM